MKVTLWGTRGSLASPGPETTYYGGNTSCVEVQDSTGAVLVLDAGTGIRRLGASLPKSLARVDILLTHLHLDHIEGLGFFAPLYSDTTEAHIWGPASTTASLRTRLTRYLSPPLFPVHLRDLPNLWLHDLPLQEFSLGGFRVSAELVCHPGPTVGYRVADSSATLAYLPDHEPALGACPFPLNGEWTSGYATAQGAYLLIHDAQYTIEEYPKHIGWGHSAWNHTIEFATLAGVKRLVPFHHDPLHSDRDIDLLASEAQSSQVCTCPITPGAEGAVFEL